MNINIRLGFLIKQLDLNATSFSKEIGYTNNVTIGRLIKLPYEYKPSYQTICLIKNRYPLLNLNWFMAGEGEIWLDEDDIKSTETELLKEYLQKQISKGE